MNSFRISIPIVWGLFNIDLTKRNGPKLDIEHTADMLWPIRTYFLIRGNQKFISLVLCTSHRWYFENLPTYIRHWRYILYCWGLYIFLQTGLGLKVAFSNGQFTACCIFVVLKAYIKWMFYNICLWPCFLVLEAAYPPNILQPESKIKQIIFIKTNIPIAVFNTTLNPIYLNCFVRAKPFCVVLNYNT